MKKILDFHSHSRFSRACSPQLTIQNIARACEIKGIDIVGTSDFTHPLWFKECQEQLEETSSGLFSLENKTSPTQFILATEVACIYKHAGATRRLHLILLAPSFDAVKKLIHVFNTQGRNLHSDGRPILGLSGKELLKIMLDIDERCELIPAHAWTPWFAVFGSKSGYNSLEECFEELTPYIHAIETGLSSDPKMNWQVSALDNITLVSNSDAHGLENFGREANVLDLSFNSYDEILQVVRGQTRKKFLYTLEMFPEEGKYHTDGHRDCHISLTPQQTKKLGGICPKCKKQLTVGVLNRVNELGDRAYGFKPEHAIDYKSCVPLKEIIASVIGVQKSSKKIGIIYQQLIEKVGNEFYILLDAHISDIAIASSTEIAEGIRRVRFGEVHVIPGYDGEYGVVSVLKPGETIGLKQMSLM